MKSFNSYLRIFLLLCIVYFGASALIDRPDGQTVYDVYPNFWILMLIVLLIGVSIEISLEAFKSVLYRSLAEDAKERFEANKKSNEWFKNLYEKLTQSKPISQESEIVLDHNYDGIRELDNRLPPWWVYLFYITIIFGVIYMVRYHIFDGPTQNMEYIVEVEKAEQAIAEYKKTAKDFIDAETVEVLTEVSDLAAGKAIFETNCVACHKSDGGGGIGPNLTDEYWILGGGIKNIYKTIAEGGRPGKGMIPWKNELSPLEMAQVSSYVLNFQGTTPAEPKAPEGEVWSE
ncbi:MAG: cbb3-type cytochrome c oxidase N-terminal domain-containing protein [Flavobacteriaceae bacterium]|nr:cbb3-type cytochrome c oxidase N-terminal domain-containing protein [Flavobacteriaceae bacterium]